MERGYRETPRSNASALVTFYTEQDGSAQGETARSAIFVPTSAVRDGAVFVYLEGRAVRREVKTGGTTIQGLRIDDGLYGGEDLIVSPPADLQDGDRVQPTQG